MRATQAVLLIAGFVACNVGLGLSWIVSGNPDYVLLSLCIGTPFLIAALIASTQRAQVLMVYAWVAFISAWVGPIGFFFQRDTFVSSGGQNAIKTFNFDVLQFIGFYEPVIFAHFLMLAFASFFLRFADSALPRAAPASHQALSIPGRRRLYRVLFYGMLATLPALNAWMFASGIGITGIDPPSLPFKLSGILYYFSRFIVPCLFIWLVSNFRPAAIELLLLFAYATFAAFSSVSRTVLVLLTIPVFLVVLRDRRLLVGLALGAMLAVIYPYLGYARDFVYLAEGGISTKNQDYSLWETAFNAVLSNKAEVIDAPLQIIGRIGGGQDVALAGQYDNSIAGGPTMEFVRLYIYDFFDLAAKAQSEMYDFTYELHGFATGDGGFFAHILLISGGDPRWLIIIAAFLALLLVLGEAVARRLTFIGLPADVVLFYAIFFNILFFALSIPMWLNTFVICSYIATRLSISQKIVRVLYRMTPA